MIDVDTSWKPFEVNTVGTQDPIKFISFEAGVKRIEAATFELLFEDGTTKKFKNTVFRPVSGLDGFWSYDLRWNNETRRMDKVNLKEFDQVFAGLKAIRPHGVERLARLHKTVQVGDIVRFSGTRDSKSWREITDINYTPDFPFMTSVVGQKIRWVRGKDFDHLVREPIMTTNFLKFGLERLVSGGNKFKIEKL